MDAAPAGRPVRAHVWVRGRVQGVGFRFFVARHARELGLAGWVRNLPDGRVELVAEGPQAAVDALLALAEPDPRVAPAVQVDLNQHFGFFCRSLYLGFSHGIIVPAAAFPPESAASRPQEHGRPLLLPDS
ncbi:MAG: acylphosphatase [Firmicutes bacterium]|nr:acylphosphatase [Bacillota bacterium]